MLLLSLVLFLLVLALPAVPSIFEVRSPKDDGRLHIMEQYVRDPRWFGRSFRHKLAPFVNEARGNRYGRAELRMRTDEEVRWSPDLLIPPLERLRGIGVAPPTGGVLFDVWNVTVAQIAPIIPYLLLVLILIFRPTGLMGTREH